MSVDQVIEAARLWGQGKNTAEIAAVFALPEAVIANNLWRIRRLADVDAA